MPDEIVIADDGSGSETKGLIQKFQKESDMPVRHVWHEDKGFRKSKILNKAVKTINSEYIVEIDGDIILHPEFIADHIDASRAGYFVQGSRSMIIQSQVSNVLSKKKLTYSIFSKSLYNRFNAIRIPFLSRLFTLLPSNPFHIKACNIAFWKKDFMKINGYDNRFEGWGGEDYEFGARLIHAGIKSKRLKMSALAYHIYHRESNRDNRGPNDQIYRSTLAQKLTYTQDGCNQV